MALFSFSFALLSPSLCIFRPLCIIILNHILFIDKAYKARDIIQTHATLFKIHKIIDLNNTEFMCVLLSFVLSSSFCVYFQTSVYMRVFLFFHLIFFWLVFFHFIIKTKNNSFLIAYLCQFKCKKLSFNFFRLILRFKESDWHWAHQKDFLLRLVFTTRLQNERCHQNYRTNKKSIAWRFPPMNRLRLMFI